MAKTLAEGHYCKECEWFEEDVEFSDARPEYRMCTGCGCPKASHVKAKVVEISG